MNISGFFFSDGTYNCALFSLSFSPACDVDMPWLQHPLHTPYILTGKGLHGDMNEVG
jgi:hypothetical protein